MNCKNHFEEEAYSACAACGEAICTDCTVDLNDKTYCRECLSQHIEKKPIALKRISGTRKSKFLTFCLGAVPGAGYMYLGLMNKGLRLMSLYFVSLFSLIAVESIIHVQWVTFMIAPLTILSVFYSIFDSLAVAAEINAGREVCDSLPIDITYYKDRITNKKSFVGYLIIVLGGIGILNLMTNEIDRIMNQYFNIGFSLTSYLVPVLLIGFGIYLIKKK